MEGSTYKDDNWIEELLFPLIEILECVESIEVYMYGLNREQFILNENDVAEPVKDIIVLMSVRLKSMLEKYNMIFVQFPEIKWEKCVKLGKALEMGYWKLVYQLCWRLSTEGIEKIKTAVLELLYHARNY